MLLAMAPPKKPLRLSEKVVRFPKILECDNSGNNVDDNIDADSLEEYSGNDDQKVSLFLTVRKNLN